MRMRKLIDKARGKAKMSERSEQEPQTASSATNPTISSESDGSLPSSSSSSSQCRSLLDVLKAPQRSDLARKRRIAQNLPHDGRRNKATKRSHDPKSVVPAQRVKEFPGECLSVSANKLFCVACREEVALKRSIITSHIGSSKHVEGKARLQSKEAREKDIASSLQAYSAEAHDRGAEAHDRGETMPEDHRVYRVKVLMAFLRAGIALNKIESAFALFWRKMPTVSAEGGHSQTSFHLFFRKNVHSSNKKSKGETCL